MRDAVPNAAKPQSRLSCEPWRGCVNSQLMNDVWSLDIPDLTFLTQLVRLTRR